MPVVADDGKVWLALVRGDRRLHELKLSKVLRQATRAGHARGDRGGVRRQAGLDRARSASARARSAASSPTRRCARARG